MRQMSYLEDTPLSGPVDDPDGWAALPTITLLGDIFNIRDVEIEYQVSPYAK